MLNQSVPSFTGVKITPKQLKTMLMPLTFLTGLVGGVCVTSHIDEESFQKFNSNCIEETFGAYNKEKSYFETFDAGEYIELSKYIDNTPMLPPMILSNINTEQSKSYADEIVENKKSKDIKKILDNYNKDLLNKYSKETQIQIENDGETLSPQYSDSLNKFRKEMVNILAEEINAQDMRIKENMYEKISLILNNKSYSEAEKTNDIQDLLREYGKTLIEAPIGTFETKTNKKENEKIKNAIKGLYKEIGVKLDDKDAEKLLSTIKEKQENKPTRTTEFLLYFLITGFVTSSLAKAHKNRHKAPTKEV